METRSENSSVSSQPVSRQRKPDTSLVSERLTNSEIESLQQDKRESIAWARKEFAKEPKTTAD